MESDRYAPPRAAVGDVFQGGDVTQPVRVWPASGRLGRLRLFVWNVGLYIVFFLALVVIGLIGIGDGTASIVLMGIVYVAYIVVFSVFMVQRSHDMDLSGWWALLNIIPFVYLYWQFKAGTPGTNRWGPPPEPNTATTKVVAWVAGILALIVLIGSMAIGGFAGYSAERARQQQGTGTGPK